MYETRAPRKPPMRILDIDRKPIYIFPLENAHYAFSNYAPVGFYHTAYEMEFKTAQQCYAFQKAREFRDFQLKDAIMNTPFDARLQKLLFKRVKLYIDEQWTDIRELVTKCADCGKLFTYLGYVRCALLQI